MPFTFYSVSSSKDVPLSYAMKHVLFFGRVLLFILLRLFYIFFFAQTEVDKSKLLRIPLWPFMFVRLLNGARPEKFILYDLRKCYLHSKSFSESKLVGTKVVKTIPEGGLIQTVSSD